MDKNETTMKVCMMVECGGLEQPHSHDDSVGGLDCDGPCSDRRVADYRANLTAPNTKPTKALYGRYDMCGREVLLIPLDPQNRDETVIECFDCSAPAHCVVIERPDGRDIAKDAWTWCGVCQVG